MHSPFYISIDLFFFILVARLRPLRYLSAKVSDVSLIYYLQDNRFVRRRNEITIENVYMNHVNQEVGEDFMAQLVMISLY